MQKIHAPLRLAEIHTMPIHRFADGKTNPIGVLVLEQDSALLEPLCLCSGDMILQYNGCDAQNFTQSKIGWQEGAPEAYTQLQVLRAGCLVNLVIE